MCLQWDIQHDGSICQEAILQAQNLISEQGGSKTVTFNIPSNHIRNMIVQSNSRNIPEVGSLQLKGY